MSIIKFYENNKKKLSKFLQRLSNVHKADMEQAKKRENEHNKTLQNETFLTVVWPMNYKITEREEHK